MKEGGNKMSDYWELTNNLGLRKTADRFGTEEQLASLNVNWDIIDKHLSYTTGIAIEKFGAKSVTEEAGFDSTQAFADAMNSVITELYVEGEYEVKLDRVTYAGKGTGIAIKLRSNIRIYGPGTIRLIGGQSGSCAVMANPTDSIDNCILEGITIDGNRDNNTGNIANAILFGATNSHYRGVYSKRSGYVGLMIRGVGTRDNSVSACKVEDSDYIGIQCQRHEGLHVVNNTVRNSGDNGIDLEGNDNIGGVTNLGFGKQMVIAGNVVDNANSGLFIESTGQVLAYGNFLYNTNVGVFVNRIDSGSYMNGIHSNIIINMPWVSGYVYDAGDRIVTGSKVYECTIGGTSAVAPSHASGTAKDGTLEWKFLRTLPSNYGMRFNNNVGKGLVTNNHIRGFLYGVRLVSAASYLVFKDNYFSDIQKYLFAPATGANSFIKSQIGENFYEGTQSGGFPKTIAPTTESPTYSTRVFNVGVKSAISLETASALRDVFYYKTSNTDSTRSGWGGAFAIFNSGETKIYTPTNQPATGDYVKINGTFYYVQANAGGELTIRNASKVAGDYTTALNASYPVYVHTASEYTAVTTD